MANTYTLIASLSASGSSNTFDFQNIPQTYTDLAIMLSLRSSAADGIVYDGIGMAINNTYSGYSDKQLYGTGTGAGSAYDASYRAVGIVPTSNATANTFGNAIVYIPNYTSSSNKSASTDAVMENNATLSYIYLTVFMQTITSPITRLIFDTSRTGAAWATGSTAYLYGVKNS